MGEDFVEELFDAVGLACSDHIVISLVLLQHEPHGFDVILCMTPIALGIKVFLDADPSAFPS
jgi:hypothetical protein